MFSTDFIFRQPENLVDNQKCQAGFRPLSNKRLFNYLWSKIFDYNKIILNGFKQFERNQNFF